MESEHETPKGTLSRVKSLLSAKVDIDYGWKLCEAYHIERSKMEAKKQQSPDPSKGDQVVKDLEYFLDEESRKIEKATIGKRTFYSSFFEVAKKEPNFRVTLLKLAATERWYKHQLEEKDNSFSDLLKEYENLEKSVFALTATIAENEKAIIDNADDFLRENGELRATIEEQKKEIGLLKEESIKEYWRGWKNYGESL